MKFRLLNCLILWQSISPLRLVLSIQTGSIFPGAEVIHIIYYSKPLMGDARD